MTMEYAMQIRSLVLAAALLLSSPLLAEVPLDPGSTATIRLSPQGALVYPVAPRPPRAPANFGAILSIDIDEPGRYHVALGARGWVDVFKDGKALASVDHKHDEPGTGIAKIVYFDLVAGHYTVALSGMTAGEVSVTVAR
jgi:hypothetical protein